MIRIKKNYVVALRTAVKLGLVSSMITLLSGCIAALPIIATAIPLGSMARNSGEMEYVLTGQGGLEAFRVASTAEKCIVVDETPLYFLSECRDLFVDLEGAIVEEDQLMVTGKIRPGKAYLFTMDDPVADRTAAVVRRLVDSGSTIISSDRRRLN